MEFGFIITSILLILFAVLGFYDGFYLHIFKYRLYEHVESKFEHFTHTIRALLFPLILFFLCLGQSLTTISLGIFFVVLDIVVLGIDAYSEKDSRVFMGGLPRWEYILHLFVNGFHFALITTLLVLKLHYTNGEFILTTQFESVKSYAVFIILVKNILPGAILLSFLHIVVSFKTTMPYWNNLRNRIRCC